MIFGVVHTQKGIKSPIDFKAGIEKVIWCDNIGKEFLIQTKSNSIYRSESYGAAFKEVANSKVEYKKILRSNADNKTIIITNAKGIFWISSDCGKTISILNKGFKISQVFFHPFESKWILAMELVNCKEGMFCFPGTHSLHFSRDLGVTWEQIATNIKQFEWAYQPPFTKVYALQRTDKQDELVVSDDFFNTKTTLVKHCLRFQRKGNYSFAIQGHKQEEIKLLVNKLNDNYTTAVFPNIKLKLKNIHILDTSEDVIFILITKRADSLQGNLYVSDYTGVKYTLSLKHCVIDYRQRVDFVKVKGTEGVYMANIRDDKFDIGDNEIESNPMNPLLNNIRTVISFNRGGSWGYITPPRIDSEGKLISCKNQCYLNFFLLLNTKIPIYGEECAHGLIIGSGNVGRYHDSDLSKSNTYLSKDGGLNWIEVGKELHAHGILSCGNIILLSKLYNTAEHKAKLIYSWNEGVTWEKLRVSNKKSITEGIFTLPYSNSKNFLMSIIEYNEITNQSANLTNTTPDIKVEIRNSTYNLTQNYTLKEADVKNDSNMNKTWTDSTNRTVSSNVTAFNKSEVTEDKKINESLKEDTNIKNDINVVKTNDNKTDRKVRNLVTVNESSIENTTQNSTNETVIISNGTFIYSLNLDKHYSDQCKEKSYPGKNDSDYEIWSPFDPRRKSYCFLGRKSFYIRKKEDRKCYNDIAFSPAIRTENCKCTEEDYECDIGFMRKENEATCTSTQPVNINIDKYCLYASSYNISSGYRKIVGDSCQEGIMHDPLIITCPIMLTMTRAQFILLLALGVVVIIMLGIENMYKNFEEVRKRADYKSVKYGRVEEIKHDEY